MRRAAAILGNDVGNIDSVEKRVSDLIQRLNDPDHEHILRSTFQETDGFDVISAIRGSCQ